MPERKHWQPIAYIVGRISDIYHFISNIKSTKPGIKNTISERKKGFPQLNGSEFFMSKIITMMSLTISPS
jgi:hypothetical protein